ncbi:murein biosynthesis integral membrane protein MurJ [Aurantimicrobium minutum]|uniref:murein biosynthesis integral membrane protein MurJ n=1 Tax=Aurantimicrobium minutum TaxID=708131 RepID=UPI002475ADF5|nr:lipid II flippase MurJ [Aurantimicrobium minutum]MDH6238638.1 putative peptidoglycan lipid II flippase [Aurantimicrobium minutum]
MSNPQASVGRASVLLGSGTVVSRALGFFKAIILAQALGVVASAGADAFAVANQMPNSIYVLVSGGVLTATLVPAIVKSASHTDGGASYVNKLMTMTILVLLGVTAVAMIAAPLLITLYATQWSADQLALATAFAYWCLPQIFFYGLYTILGEVLNARGSFGPFTWAPALNNVVGILGIVAFMLLFGVDTAGERSVVDWTPAMVAVLAGSATAGVAAQALILTVFWKKNGLSFAPDFVWRGVGLRETGKMVGWTFGVVLLTQLSIIVQTNVVALASGQGASVFTMTTAWLIFLLPHSIIAVSMGTVYFTRMSKDHAGGNREGMARDASTALRQIGLFICWAAAGLLAVAFPLSRIFSENFLSVINLGWLIMVLVLGLPAFSAVYVMFRIFLVQGKAPLMFWLTVLQVGVYVVLILLSSQIYVTVITLAVCASLAISVIIQAIVTWAVLRKTLPEVRKSGVASTAVRGYIAAAIAGFIGLIVSNQFGSLTATGYAQESILNAIVAMVGIGLVVTGVFVLLLWIMRVKEVRQLFRQLGSRLSR